MCDFCTAATVGEAEHHYAQIRAGQVSDLMPSFLGIHTPRAGLQQRQKEELEDKLFLPAPQDQAFRNDLQGLCDNFGTYKWVDFHASHPVFSDVIWDYAYGFENCLVSLREYHKREVLSNKEVLALVAKAALDDSGAKKKPALADA